MKIAMATIGSAAARPTGENSPRRTARDADGTIAAAETKGRKPRMMARDANARPSTTKALANAANDSVTVAVEVPVYLTRDDIAYYRSRGFDVDFEIEVITGHIDFLQIRKRDAEVLRRFQRRDELALVLEARRSGIQGRA